MVKTCVLYMSICFTITVNQTATSLKNFNNAMNLQLYIWYFNPCYHNLPRHIFSRACIFWLFKFASSAYFPSTNGNLSSFSFKQSGHRFVLTLYLWYCPKIFHTKSGSSFKPLFFQNSFDSCQSFLSFSCLKDFLCSNILF